MAKLVALEVGSTQVVGCSGHLEQLVASAPAQLKHDAWHPLKVEDVVSQKNPETSVASLALHSEPAL